MTAEKAIKMVQSYTASLDTFDPKVEFDVYVVWQCYILGNQKWLLATTLNDGMYYEVTYNKNKDEFYFDAYKKVETRRYGGTVVL